MQSTIEFSLRSKSVFLFETQFIKDHNMFFIRSSREVETAGRKAGFLPNRDVLFRWESCESFWRCSWRCGKASPPECWRNLWHIGRLRATSYCRSNVNELEYYEHRTKVSDTARGRREKQVDSRRLISKAYMEYCISWIFHRSMRALICVKQYFSSFRVTYNRTCIR